MNIKNQKSVQIWFIKSNFKIVHCNLLPLFSSNVLVHFFSYWGRRLSHRHDFLVLTLQEDFYFDLYWILVFVTLLAKNFGLNISLWSFVIKNKAPKLSAILEHSTQIVETYKTGSKSANNELLWFVMWARWQGKANT